MSILGAKITFTPCCEDGEILEFGGQVNEAGPNGWWNTVQGTVWKYTPSPSNPELEGCYTVTHEGVELAAQPATPAPTNSEMVYLADTCAEAFVLEPDCNCGTTVLIPCCQGDDSLYFQPTSRVFNNAEAYLYKDKTYTVVKNVTSELSNLPTFPNESEVIATGTPCDDSECCVCIRVRSKDTIIAPISVVIVNCDGVNETLIIPIDRVWSEKVCARSWDLSASFEVEMFGDCESDGLLPPSKICPISTCFLLTDCEGIEDDIYVSYTSIQTYIDTANILKLDGFPNTCWSFREISECECAIEVTVISSWTDCEECRKCKGYKLTNCEDSNYIKYTTNDLSEYIDQAVEFENCAGCWFVECLEIAPPSDQNLIVQYSFKNCKTCLSTFWKLTPCPGQIHDVIYTDTDLVAYEGFIVTLDNIPGICFELEEVRELKGNTFETVFINEYYTDCDSCKADLSDCVCSTAVNGGTISGSLQYLDCNGSWIETAIIPSGARTPKVCAIEWNLENAIDIEWYGDCTEEIIENESSIWECPEVISKTRSVRPGYNTPGCPADYYDKVSCNFAEAYYKIALEDRYGISTNCKTIDLNKWEIKKEMLNLTAITNPDYVCPPTNACFDPCAAPSKGFIDCTTGACLGYTITYETDAPDDITSYTDCETNEIITIEHVLTDTVIVYTICVTPGTPIITEGFLELLGDCPEPLIPCSCSTYIGAINNGTPGTIPYIDCDGIQTDYVFPGTTGEWDPFTFCGQPGQTLVPSENKGFHFDEVLCCGNASVCISSTLTFPANLEAGVYSWLDCNGVAQAVTYPFVITEYSVEVCAQQGTLFTDGPTVVEGGLCP